MSPIASNPALATYSSRQMYVTPWEFTNSATGVDTNSLVPGDVNASRQALVVQLLRASGVVDNYCQKVLGATVDTAHGEARVQNHWALGAYLDCPLEFTPVVQLVSASTGSTPGSLLPLADLSNVAFKKSSLQVPLPSGGPLGPFGNGPTRFYSLQYVNGWANTTLSAAAAANATSITVASATGLGPGMALNIQSKLASEVVVIASTFTPSPTGVNVPVPLASGLVNGYAANDVATVMPQDVKEATVLVTKALIKTRGDTAIVLNGMTSGPGREVAMAAGVDDELGLAEFLLKPYRRSV